MSAQDVIQLLGKAILDANFRAQLLSDPEWALNQFSLTGSEREAVKAIKPEQLQALVDQFAKGGGDNVNQFLMKMIGDPNTMAGGVWDPGTLLGGPDVPPPNPDNPGGPQPHLEPEGPAPHLEQGGLGGPDTTPEGDVSGDVNGDMPGRPLEPCVVPGDEPGAPIDPCVVPGDMHAAPLDPCVVPEGIGDPGIKVGPSPHMQPGDKPGGEGSLPEPHMRPGSARGLATPGVLIGLGLLGLLGLLLFGPAGLLGGMFSPLDAIGCTGVEQPQNYTPASGLMLVSNPLQGITEEGPEEFQNQMGWFFNFLNGLRGAVGQPPILYHPDCDMASAPSVPNVGPIMPNAQCGNGVINEGEECDGNADIACTAQGGAPKYCGPACQCVVQGAAVCGNNHTDPGEQCDGTDDILCTMQAGAIAKTCGQNCQCVPVGGGQGGQPTEACVPIAGDGVCSACENTDLDSDSCVCTINGVCEAGEGLNCPDCAPTAMPDACSNSTCGDGQCNAACGEDINSCAADCHL